MDVAEIPEELRQDEIRKNGRLRGEQQMSVVRTGKSMVGQTQETDGSETT